MGNEQSVLEARRNAENARMQAQQQECRRRHEENARIQAQQEAARLETQRQELAAKVLELEKEKVAMTAQEKARRHEENARMQAQQQEAARLERQRQQELAAKELELEKQKAGMAAEEKKQKLELEKELETKRLQLEHEVKTRQLENTEKRLERSTALVEKRNQLEHDRLMHSQEKVLSIVANLFQKVEISDMRDAAFGAMILKSIGAGEPVDKDVLKAVAAKVQDAPPTNIKQLVHNVIKTCAEEEDEERATDNGGLDYSM